MNIVLPTVETVSCIGSWSDLSFSIEMVVYFIIVDTPLIDDSGVRWDEFYYLMDFSKKETTDYKKVKAADKLYVHRLSVSIGRDNRIYGILEKSKEFSLKDVEEDINYKQLVTLLSDLMPILIDLGELEGDLVPPNQLEGVIDYKLTDDVYYCPINPPKDTSRRTLSYTNYIFDGNTVVKGEPGVGYDSYISPEGWLVYGKMRNDFMWPRMGIPTLTSNEVQLCDNSQLGVRTTSDFMIPSWKGANTFNKLPYSVMAIPMELYYFGGSAMRKFNSKPISLTQRATSTYHRIPVLSHWPVVVTDPIGASGWLDTVDYTKVESWCRNTMFLHPYSRPYIDESDGSGTWHGLA